MKRNILNSITALALVITVAGCASRKKLPVQETVTAVPPSETVTKAATISAINSSQLVFETFAVRAKAGLSIDNNKNDVTMHIRIRKDQAIWISVTAIAGLEVARALITPDSIKVINRIESVYMKKPFSYVYSFTSKQVNFKTLQSLFTGNAIEELVTEEAAIALAPVLQLSGSWGKLTYDMAFTDQKKVLRLNLEDADAAQELKVSYGDFADVNGKIVPQSVNISSRAAKKHIVIDLKYNKTDIDMPADMPFNVPKRFAIKN